MFILMT